MRARTRVRACACACAARACESCSHCGEVTARQLRQRRSSGSAAVHAHLAHEDVLVLRARSARSVSIGSGRFRSRALVDKQRCAECDRSASPRADLERRSAREKTVAESSLDCDVHPRPIRFTGAVLSRRPLRDRIGLQEAHHRPIALELWASSRPRLLWRIISPADAECEACRGGRCGGFPERHAPTAIRRCSLCVSAVTMPRDLPAEATAP